MARPPKLINWEVVEKRMECGNSAQTIADSFCIDINTFYRRFKEHYELGFADFIDRARSAGKSNIAYTQYMKALSGNPQMLMFLGRNWLGQDKEEIKESPQQDLIELMHKLMLMNAENIELKEKLNAIRGQVSEDSSIHNESEARQELPRSYTPL